eukprot:PITA_32535
MKLVNTDMSNGLFTWNNKRGRESQVATKLDRFIIAEDLMFIDKEMIVRILPFGGSDHWLVQLEIQGIGTPKIGPFRFENIWPTHPDFIINITKWWTKDLHIQGTRMFLLHKRLKHIKLRLKDWNKNEFGNIFEAKKTVEDRMWELNEALIMDGFDKDEGGHLLNSHEDIEAVLVLHFHGIEKETISDRDHFIKDLIGHIPRLVTREDNFNLNRPVTEEEVSEVIKEMQYGKAPGPDGFNVDFFKAFLNIVKHDILNVVEDSRMNRTILKELNTSFISLISKHDNTQNPDRFRPIAFCNVVYRIVSKVVANRIKPLLPTLVSMEQSGYVEGRKILNNIIQAHEVVHSLTSNMKAGMIMQLDLAKSYDKLN